MPSPPRDVLWNKAPFNPVLPVHRSFHIVRTRPVTMTLQRQYAREGWPPELILLREFSVKLVGDEITLTIVTNAPEAECELPSEITTPARTTGTFRNSVLVWQGREDEAFVSVHLNSEQDRKAIEQMSDSAAVFQIPPEQLASMAMAQRTLQSGLLIPATAALPSQMEEEERELANLLLAYKDPDQRRVFSLAEIGKRYNCSDETIRRRMKTLLEKHPTLKGSVAAIRTRNNKGIHPSAIYS